MKKRFMVTDSSNPEYIREVFEARTEIKKDVKLPFTEDEYRCFMFTGVQIKLINGENYIIGELY